MTASRANGFPRAAAEWLAGDCRAPLIVGRASAALTRVVTQRGRGVTLVDPDRSGLARLRLPAPLAFAVVADPSALPFAPLVFDVVLIAQGLHLGPPRILLSQFARVLAVGGRLGVCYTVRDDTIPWVRRLAALMQSVDPTAMRGDFGDESVAALTGNPYFPKLETREFRQWVPVKEQGLVDMVARSAAAKQIDDDDVRRLLADVRLLYANAARGSDLLLPYRVRCWRATVDHSEVTGPLTVPDEGLRITL